MSILSTDILLLTDKLAAWLNKVNNQLDDNTTRIEALEKGGGQSERISTELRKAHDDGFAVGLTAGKCEGVKAERARCLGAIESHRKESEYSCLAAWLVDLKAKIQEGE